MPTYRTQGKRSLNFLSALGRCLASGFLCRAGVVQVVPAVAVEVARAGVVGTVVSPSVAVTAPEPGEFRSGSQALGLLASVLLPLDVGFPAEEAGAFLAACTQLGVHEGPGAQPQQIGGSRCVFFGFDEEAFRQMRVGETVRPRVRGVGASL